MIPDRIFLLDFESRSLADIKLGGRVYWLDPTTEPVCCAWVEIQGEEEIRSGVWLPGDPCPFPRGAVLGAHNMMGFDRFGVDRLGWDFQELIDTAELARKSGLPGGLDALAARLFGDHKDTSGNKVTMALSLSPVTGDVFDRKTGALLRKGVPEELKAPLKAYAKACKALGGWAPIPPEVLARVIAYCQDDVRIMTQLWHELRDWHDVDADVSRVERVVNDRGVPFDTVLARRLLEEDGRNGAEALTSIAAELGLDVAELKAVARSPQKFMAATAAPDAQANTIKNLIAWAPSDPEAALYAQARQALATIAKGKLEAGLNLEINGRLYDAHKYFGAHTGRWSGRGMQMQNMPRPAKEFEDWGAEEICAAADRILAGGRASPGEIEVLLRATICAPEGYVLCVCDFSGVENRSLAFHAGDWAEIERIKQGVDPYKTLAAEQIYRVPYDQVTKIQRAAGKIGVLACLGPNTEVLTGRGWIPITYVLESDLLWDGEEWVTSSGVVPRGRRQVMELDGVSMTPNHQILVRDQWIQAGDLSPTDRNLARETGLESLRSWRSIEDRRAESSLCSADAPFVDTSGTPSGLTSSVGLRPGAISAPSERPRQPKRCTGGTRQSVPTIATEGGSSTACPPRGIDARTRGIKRTRATEDGAFAFTSRGGRTSRMRCAISSPLKGGTSRVLKLIGSIIRKDTNRGTCGSPYVLTTRETRTKSGPYESRCKNWSDVYDIANAGPRNRFTIRTDSGALVVHNCGYGGGPRAIENMAEGVGVNLAELARDGVTPRKIVDAWRAMHPAVVKFWYDVERAFIGAVKGKASSVGRFEFVPSDDGDAVAIFLPSGRPIVYHEPELVRDGRRTQITFLGNKSGREYTYGGKLTENIIQADCRELMAAALVRVENDPLAPVPIMHVHDEIVCLEKEEKAKEGLDRLRRRMVELPEWAEGFPIGAEGYVSRRYMK